MKLVYQSYSSIKPKSKKYLGSDYYEYTGFTIAEVINGTMTGEVIISGGVGRYEGVSGTVVLTGTLNTGMDVTFTGEGYLYFPFK